MNSQTFFPHELKVNLKVETSPITITKIEEDEELKLKLLELGISGFDKVNKNHTIDQGIFKAFCKNDKDRLKILMRSEFVIETNKLKYTINTKPLVWPLESCRRCHKFSHIHPKNGKSSKCGENDLLACFKCNSFAHTVENCTAASKRCINCGGSSHNSIEKRQCLEYIKWEEKSHTDKLNNLLAAANFRRLASREGYKRGKLVLHSYDVRQLGQPGQINRMAKNTNVMNETQMSSTKIQNKNKNDQTHSNNYTYKRKTR